MIEGIFFSITTLTWPPKTGPPHRGCQKTAFWGTVLAMSPLRDGTLYNWLSLKKLWKFRPEKGGQIGQNNRLFCPFTGPKTSQLILSLILEWRWVSVIFYLWYGWKFRDIFLDEGGGGPVWYKKSDEKKLADFGII